MEAATGGDVAAWAARINLADAWGVARLRLFRDIEAAIVGDALWLRGHSRSESLDAAMSHIAPIARYTVDAQHQLIPIDKLLPDAAMPRIEWSPLRELFAIEVERSALPATAPDAACALSLVRSPNESPADAILIDLDAFAAWCSTAPDIRLDQLRYAVSDDRAFVIGSPLPPVAGARLYVSDGIVVPCGFAIAPAVDAASLRDLLQLADDDLALFDHEGWQRIPAGALTLVTRAGVRLMAIGAPA